MVSRIRMLLPLLVGLALMNGHGAAALAEGPSRQGLPWVEGKLIVGFEPGTTEREARALLLDPGIVDDLVTQIFDPEGFRRFYETCDDYLPLPPIYRLTFASQAAAVSAAAQLAEAPGVRFVDRSWSLAPASDPPLPNDPRFGEQWGLHNTGQGDPYLGLIQPEPDADIDAPEAWAMGALGQGQVIAILDGGVYWRHEDLAENIWENPGETGLDGQGRDRRSNGIDDDGNYYVDDWHGWNLQTKGNDPSQGSFPNHGSHVAGIAAARGDNGIGISGVAPRARIMPVTITFSGIFEGKIPGDNIEELLEAFAYAIRNDADVISNSHGSLAPIGRASPLYALASACAEAAGLVVVWAGGNSEVEPLFPQSVPATGSIVAGAFNRYDLPWLQSEGGSSQLNPAINDVMAPGHQILSTISSGSFGDTYVPMSGTSMAAPHVAGVAALVRSTYPDLTPAQVKRAIKDGAEFSPALAPWSSSLGRLNAAGALRKAADPGPIPPLPDP